MTTMQDLTNKPEIKSLSPKYFESYSAELLGKLGRINQLVGGAREAIGNYHEEILKRTIQNFLTRRFSLKSGYIFKNESNVSNQTDIMIVDENCTFTYFFQEGNFAIVKPDAVVCAIEVKTDLNKETLPQAILNIARAKEIKKSASQPLIGWVFGYRSPDPTVDWIKNVLSDDKLMSLRDSKDYWPNGIVFLEKGALLYRTSNESQSGYKNIWTFKEKNNLKANQAIQLSFFLSVVAGSLSFNESKNQGKFIENGFEQLLCEGGSIGLDEYFIENINKE
jgi:hypothetical protein